MRVLFIPIDKSTPVWGEFETRISSTSILVRYSPFPNYYRLAVVHISRILECEGHAEWNTPVL